MDIRPTPCLLPTESRGATVLTPVNEPGPRSQASQPQPALDTAATLGTSKPATQQQTENSPPTSSRYPSFPLPSMITKQHGMLHPDNLTLLNPGARNHMYQCLEGCAYNTHASEREIDLMTAAGDCSVTPLSRVLREADGGGLVQSGLLMELATPLDFGVVPAKERRAVMEEMVCLAERLPGRGVGIVHGDIKPGSFLRCRDGRLRLCGFGSARLVGDEEVEGWEGGVVSERYLAPGRGFPEVGPPEVVDDEYASAISVWELFTGKEALVREDMEEVLKEGRTVDLGELEDDDVRDFVRKRLRDGGAKV